MNFLEELKSILIQNKNFISENGKLLKTKIIEASMKIDPELIKLLLSNRITREYFFIDIEETLVFDKIKFSWLIESKEFLPDSYTSFKQDIGLINSDNDFIVKGRDIFLSWPYKDCLLKGGQTKEDDKRDEIFYNELLAPDQINRLLSPKVFTNIFKYDGNSKKEINTFDINDNFIIKGNNIIVLSSLLERYRGKIKCIYIDPPYNTGNDSFKYNDKFNHSSWLTFMKNRLEIAFQLLHEEGTILVQIDNSPSELDLSPEYGYLMVLMDEIFGRRNYITTFTWKKKGNSSNTKDGIGTITESILAYSKDFNKLKIELQDFKRKYDYSEEGREYNLESPVKTNEGTYERSTMLFPIETKEGTFLPPNGKRWTLGKDRMSQIVSENKYEIKNNTFYVKKFIQDYKNENKKLYNNLLLDCGSLKMAKNEIKALGFEREIFDSPKPELLIQRLLEITTVENDIVLDFFLGSGTTAAVSHKMNRRYIGIEQMDYISTLTIPRLIKVIKGENGGISKELNWKGGGEFVSLELKKLNDILIDEISNTKNKKELKELLKKIIKTDYISYELDTEKLLGNIEEYSNLDEKDQKRFLINILDKNKMYVNYCDIDDIEMNVNDNEKKFTRSFYK